MSIGLAYAIWNEKWRGAEFLLDSSCLNCSTEISHQRKAFSVGICNKRDQDPEASLHRSALGGERWCYQYNPEDQAQSKQWLLSGQVIKASAWQASTKVKTTGFWDAFSILIVDFVLAHKNKAVRRVRKAALAAAGEWPRGASPVMW